MGEIKIKHEVWDLVENCFKEQKACSYKMAIIEADKSLDNLLSLKGVPGTGSKDRVLKVKEKFSNIEELFKAFELRERILNHLSYTLTVQEVDDALNAYKQAIIDIDSGGKSIPFKTKLKLFWEYYVPKKIRKIKSLIFFALLLLAVILFFNDFNFGKEIHTKLLQTARFIYYEIMVILVVAAVVVGLIFFIFLVLENKNK
jgi:hypothetical protein